MMTKFVALEAISVVVGFGLMMAGKGDKKRPITIVGAVLGIGGMLAYFADMNGAFGV